MQLIDTHTHIDVSSFDDDRAAVLDRARAAGVTRQIVPAIMREMWPGLRDVCAAHEGLFPGYGLHPVYLDAHRDEDLDALPGWIEQEKPVCIGECGLDFFVENPDRERQTMFLRRQLEMARDFERPVVLHARRAVEETIALIKAVGNITGVIHSYGGSVEQANQLFKLGFCVGIGGPVTYERANRIRRLIREMPLEFLLLETDAPDQPLHSHRGERNEPAYLVEIVECIAALRGESAEHVAATTTANAERLFKLPPAATGFRSPSPPSPSRTSR